MIIFLLETVWANLRQIECEEKLVGILNVYQKNFVTIFLQNLKDIVPTYLIRNMCEEIIGQKGGRLIGT